MSKIINASYHKSAMMVRALLRNGLFKSLKIAKKMIISYYPIYSFHLFGKVAIPSSLCIDPINICNLHCPVCPTGADKLNYEKTRMSFDIFKKIIDKIPQLKYISLFNWGEPFLNSDLFTMVKYAKKRSIQVEVHTNFSFRKQEDFFVDIVQSGIDYLKISLDGASKDTYSEYRRGGDFNLVITNIKTLMLVKNKLNSGTPIVIWKFIVNRFNEEEIGQAQKLAFNLGVRFEVAPMGVSDDLPDVDFNTTVDERKKYWLPKNRKYILARYGDNYKKPLDNGPCPSLFSSLVVNPDGKVFPCCAVTDKSSVFGDLSVDSIYDIWNNDNYKFSRSLFTGKKYSGTVTQTICSKCDNFKKRKK